MILRNLACLHLFVSYYGTPFHIDTRQDFNYNAPKVKRKRSISGVYGTGSESCARESAMPTTAKLLRRRAVRGLRGTMVPVIPAEALRILMYMGEQEPEAGVTNWHRSWD